MTLVLPKTFYYLRVFFLFMPRGGLLRPRGSWGVFEFAQICYALLLRVKLLHPGASCCCKPVLVLTTVRALVRIVLVGGPGMFSVTLHDDQRR